MSRSSWASTILGFDAYGIGAVFSVFVAPLVQRRFGATWALMGSLLGPMVILTGLALAAGHSVTTLVVLTAISGALAPFMAAKIAAHFNASATFYVAAVAVLISAVVIFAGRKFLTAHEPHRVWTASQAHALSETTAIQWCSHVRLTHGYS
ncbi:hypothetical protein [Arthrobacter sp. HLT1-20]